MPTGGPAQENIWKFRRLALRGLRRTALR
jgi:hypothetical protein